MRDLCDDCGKCKDNDKCLSYCFDVCSGPIDILETIEKMRINSGFSNLDQATGYFMAVREICNLRNDCEWPEDLEVAIDDFLQERGMRK